MPSLSMGRGKIWGISANQRRPLGWKAGVNPSNLTSISFGNELPLPYELPFQSWYVCSSISQLNLQRHKPATKTENHNFKVTSYLSQYIYVPRDTTTKHSATWQLHKIFQALAPDLPYLDSPAGYYIGLDNQILPIVRRRYIAKQYDS